MAGFTITPSRFRKVQLGAASEAELDRREIVEAIVKVSEAGYAPSEVKVRARIDPYLLTCEIPTADLGALERDPRVESVSVGRSLRFIE